MLDGIDEWIQLLGVFENLDREVKETLAAIKSPLVKALYVLAISNDRVNRPNLSVTEIVEALEAAGVASNSNSISKALSRAGNKISRKKIGREYFYRIMTSGRKSIDNLLTPKDSINVSYIEGGKPRTARKILAELLHALSGNVKICDPYYGVRTLDVLELIPASCDVKFLSAQTSEKNPALANSMHDFRLEHSNIDLRKIPDPKALHDRYILSENNLLILGHGIKDIGKKESFVVSISSEYADDLIKDLNGTFDKRWNVSIPL